MFQLKKKPPPNLRVLSAPIRSNYLIININPGTEALFSRYECIKEYLFLHVFSFIQIYSGKKIGLHSDAVVYTK